MVFSMNKKALRFIENHHERAEARALREDLIVAGWKRDRKIWAFLKAAFFFSLTFGAGMILSNIL